MYIQSKQLVKVYYGRVQHLVQCVYEQKQISQTLMVTTNQSRALSLALVIETGTTTGMNSMECIVDQARSVCEHCLRDCLPMYHRLSSLCSHNVGTQPPFLPLVCPWELYKHRQC
jgi:hypothetical protein